MTQSTFTQIALLSALLTIPATGLSQEAEQDEPENSIENVSETPGEPGVEPPEEAVEDVQEETSGEESDEPAEEATEEPTQGEGEVKPWLPPAQGDAQDDSGDYESGAAFDDIPPIDDLPFGKGQMELGFGLGGWGGSGYFSLSVGASFAYYVAPRLAPGISLEYQTIFGDLKYPQSFTTLPYLKFVIIRSRAFAPYLIGVGGREFQWAGTDDAEKGYAAVGSWIAGGGVGAHIGMGGNFALNLQVLFLYYFFDESVFIVGENDPVDGHLYIPITIGISFFI
jgi:hypothetical protein